MAGQINLNFAAKLSKHWGPPLKDAGHLRPGGGELFSGGMHAPLHHQPPGADQARARARAKRSSQHRVPRRSPLFPDHKFMPVSSVGIANIQRRMVTREAEDA